MTKKYIMSIDQGTTGTRVILFNHDGEMHSKAYREIEQIFPNPGWTEHKPEEYWETTMECAKEALEEGDATPDEIAAIGITNQRETTIMWDKETGEPVYNAIVWECRRTADMCDELKDKGYEDTIRDKTGLMIDPYFSATKIKWIFNNVPEAREKLEQGKLLMGTIDSWLIWKLTGGRTHVTDYSNASRTMLLNIHDLDWDDELFDMLDLPKEIMPDLAPSSGIMAETDKDVFFGEEIPIAGVAGDQHAATFGQTCFEPGMAKNTYGTALALMMNIGEEPILSKNGLTTDLGWMVNNQVDYALEGVIFNGGAAISWLRDGLGIIDEPYEADQLAESVDSTDGVYFVPAFTGLCAPYWDMYARGTIVGLTRGTDQAHIARSALESMAYLTRDNLEAMTEDSGKELKALRVDGGVTNSDILMQFQADILGIPVEKPTVTEMAALGAAYLAGLGVDFWDSKEEVSQQWTVEKTFEPQMSKERRDELYAGWQKAVKRSMNWAESKK